MNVEVLFFAQLREIAKVRQRIFAMPDGATLSDLLDVLEGDYGDEFRREVETLDGLRVLIGESEFGLSEAMTVSLKDNDTVVFLPPIAGG